MTNNNRFDESKSSWISRGFEQLAAEIEDDADTIFDVVIVGSGYGGAVAANTFAGQVHDGQEVRVCVLERGSEYLSGAFPRDLSEIPGHIRTDSQKEGLFDIRQGPEVGTIVANGLGGGSLINAGVMEIPLASVFEHGWPADLQNLPDWQDYFDKTRILLGAPKDNHIGNHPHGRPQNNIAMQALADPPESFRQAAITVAMDDTHNSANVRLNQCLRCGDCATGCNHGAKDSLDLNLLVHAHRNGVEIYSGATVLNIERDTANNIWIINAVCTNAQRRQRHHANNGPIRIRAKNLVLAAGALGSTEILLRSGTADLQFSPQLGRHCSTNGDMLVTDYDTDDVVNAVANDTEQPSDRSVGPSITGIIDLRADPDHPVLIENLVVPAGLRRFFTEIFTTTNALHSLNERDCGWHMPGFPNDDIYAARTDKIQNTALYAVMGDDGAMGHIELDGQTTYDRDGIGRMRWEGLPRNAIFEKEVAAVSNLCENTGGRVMPNPVWNLLPEDMQFLIDNQRGPLLTVHPLGGCTMADEVVCGVVDDIGRVFDPVTNGIHNGLVVLDGSIIPTALGTNPALTITAVALRAAETLAPQWGFATAPAAPSPSIERPKFRDTDEPVDSQPTQIQVCERMVGPVTFKDTNGDRSKYVVELTMRFADVAVAELTYPDRNHPAVLILDPNQEGKATDSRIRIYERTPWNDLRRQHVLPARMEEVLEEMAVFSAPLSSGNLHVFERRFNFAWWRTLRALWAYLWNRGFRDIWQACADDEEGPTIGQRIRGAIALATRGGEVRSLDYRLRIGQADPGSTLQLRGTCIRGRKRFTFGRRVNPWRQLTEMNLRRFPGWRCWYGRGPLELDLRFLARIGVPLFHVTSQTNGVNALAELASFFAYFVRLLLGIHMWTFRTPDAEVGYREPERLPGLMPDIPEMPPPEIHELNIGDEIPHGNELPGGDGLAHPGVVRLTRYARRCSDQPPVVMIHGYSTSGTTFAHNAVRPNMASMFWNAGRDVWIVDLRTSAGMPTASLPWSFEQVAYRDIPAAFDEVYRHTERRADVFAHCMGSVMFSMAILHADHKALPGESQEHQDARNRLPTRVRRVAFSQVGPLVVFSPANVFRSYAARYLREFLPDNYTFRPGPDPSLADQLLDRFLYSIPYPEEEFHKENPPFPPCKRTPWVRTRHRMDALYGRDFNVNNIDDEVLKYIDDFFGPLSIETVTQTIHFARYSTITDVHGRNTFVARRNFENNHNNPNDDNWHFPTLNVHGTENGLMDVSTLDRMQIILDDAGRHFEPRPIEQAGHQDCLIGDDKENVAEIILEFFDRPDNNVAPNEPAEITLVAYVPWIGPIITDEGHPPIKMIRVGAAPTHRQPEAVVMLRVSVNGVELLRPDTGDPFTNSQADLDYVLTNMVMYTSKYFRDNGWVAFEQPLPPAVAPEGNALLVLIVYAESPALHADTRDFFGVVRRAAPDDPKVIVIDPGNWDRNLESTTDQQLPSLENMRLIATAARDSLVEQSSAPTPLPHGGTPPSRPDTDPAAPVIETAPAPEPTDRYSKGDS